MLTLKLISEQTEKVIKGLEKKLFPVQQKPSTMYWLLTRNAARLKPNSTSAWLKAKNWQHKSAG